MKRLVYKKEPVFEEVEEKEGLLSKLGKAFVIGFSLPFVALIYIIAGVYHIFRKPDKVE